MLRGLYDAGSALLSATRNQEVVAENLAHATTTGYRRQGVRFDALLPGQAPAVNGGGGAGTTGTGAQTSYTSFTPGPLQQTGSSLDLALSGNGFFTLSGPAGPVYTRNGAFQISPTGELVSAGGLRVQGQGGPIAIPRDAGRIHVAADGGVFVNGAEVGRLNLAQFSDPQSLRRVGTTLFEGPAPQAPEPGSVRVEQGFREGANVEMVQEMVSLMLGLRQYEAAERTLKSLGDILGQTTRPQN